MEAAAGRARGQEPSGEQEDRGHPWAGELRGQVLPLLACRKHGLSLRDPRASSPCPAARPWLSQSPARAAGHCHGALCLSQILLPGPSKEPRTATTMSWMCHRRAPLPALGTSPREWQGTGGSVSSPQVVRGLTAALSPLQSHSTAGFAVGMGRDPAAADPWVLWSHPGWGLSGGRRSWLPPQAPFCAVPKVGSAPLQVSQEQPVSPRNSPRHTRTMMMSAAAPWGRCHEDVLAMPQPWGHVCGTVLGPCPTEVTCPCPALQESSSCVGIFFDFSVNFPFSIIKPNLVRDSFPGLGAHSGTGTSIAGTSAIPRGCEAGSGTTETSLGMVGSREEH